LLDDSTRIAEKAKMAGVKVDLEIWPEMPHVWQLLPPYLPEGQQAIDRSVSLSEDGVHCKESENRGPGYLSLSDLSPYLFFLIHHGR